MVNTAIKRLRSVLCCVLACAISSHASVIVQLKVIDGDGLVYRAGSRATHGLTVLVTDEAGKPVEDASVSFRLPDAGPTGVFSSGLRTEIVKSDASGHASIWGMQWNKTPGRVDIHITAVKDQARTGLIATQTLSDALPATAGGEGTFTPSHHSKTKWIIIGALAGGAAAGAMFGMSHGSASTAPAPPVGLSIGTPTVIVAHP